MANSQRYIRFFKEIGIGDVSRVGGKNAALGEMFQALSAQGVAVPNGFAIVADAYRHALEHAGALPAFFRGCSDPLYRSGQPRNNPGTTSEQPRNNPLPASAGTEK